MHDLLIVGALPFELVGNPNEGGPWTRAGGRRLGPRCQREVTCVLPRKEATCRRCRRLWRSVLHTTHRHTLASPLLLPLSPASLTDSWFAAVDGHSFLPSPSIRTLTSNLCSPVNARPATNAFVQMIHSFIMNPSQESFPRQLH